MDYDVAFRLEKTEGYKVLVFSNQAFKEIMQILFQICLTL